MIGVRNSSRTSSRSFDRPPPAFERIRVVERLDRAERSEEARKCLHARVRRRRSRSRRKKKRGFSHCRRGYPLSEPRRNRRKAFSVGAGPNPCFTNPVQSSFAVTIDVRPRSPACPVAPRRKRVEPQKFVHRLDRRRSVAEGGRGGQGGRPPPQGAWPHLRRRLYLRPYPRSEDAGADARGIGPDQLARIPRSGPQRAPLRRSLRAQQGRCAQEMGGGTGPLVAAQLRRAAARRRKPQGHGRARLALLLPEHSSRRAQRKAGSGRGARQFPARPGDGARPPHPEDDSRDGNRHRRAARLSPQSRFDGRLEGDSDRVTAVGRESQASPPPQGRGPTRPSAGPAPPFAASGAAILTARARSFSSQHSRAILTLCSATGIMARTRLTLSGSIRAETTPGPSDARAITWPQGSATREWPKVWRCSLPTVKEPVWALAQT